MSLDKSFFFMSCSIETSRFNSATGLIGLVEVPLVVEGLNEGASYQLNFSAIS